MYSPALRPSSTRAAPAKNRIWSTAGGISSLAISARGLPVLRHSASISSSARVSKASAIFSSARLRSDGVVSRHDSNAVAAALSAVSTSRDPETGARVYASPVPGSTTSLVRPSAVSTYLPSSKFCRDIGRCPPLFYGSATSFADSGFLDKRFSCYLWLDLRNQWNPRLYVTVCQGRRIHGAQPPVVPPWQLHA